MRFVGTGAAGRAGANGLALVDLLGVERVVVVRGADGVAQVERVPERVARHGPTIHCLLYDDDDYAHFSNVLLYKLDL